MTGKNRRTKQNQKANQKFYAVPDSVLAGARDSSQFETSVQEDGADQKDGTVTNFADIGAARNKVLQVRMDQAAQADAAAGTATNIDPKGYLTSLVSTELKASEIEIGDIKRVKTLLGISVADRSPQFVLFASKFHLFSLFGNAVPLTYHQLLTGAKCRDSIS